MQIYIYVNLCVSVCICIYVRVRVEGGGGGLTLRMGYEGILQEKNRTQPHLPLIRSWPSFLPPHLLPFPVYDHAARALPREHGIEARGAGPTCLGYRGDAQGETYLDLCTVYTYIYIHIHIHIYRILMPRQELSSLSKMLLTALKKAPEGSLQ